MIFNSLDFALFLPIVFAVFWLLNSRGVKYGNWVILIASYIFYGWWDVRYLSLIFISTCIDFFVGKAIPNAKNKKQLLGVSMFLNLGFLAVFKYLNFFIESFSSAFTFFGVPIEASTLEIILPVGISFYTFQTMSYTIDVYKGKLTPTKNFLAFASFVSFFPQLVAGPIERAVDLLPQFYQKSVFVFDNAKKGLRLILWGLFKKVVIADMCGEFANLFFNDYQNFQGASLFLGAAFFAFQIYGDFSGYSDMAIGTSKLFGFELKKNFNFPYFSKSVPEFWKNWHISLTSWFRDYLYIPLGGSKYGLNKTIRNVLIIFTVSGFWHGANWTFVIWGLLNGILFIPSLLRKGKPQRWFEKALWFSPILRVKTFVLILITWVFFRAQNIGEAFDYLKRMAQGWTKQGLIESYNHVFWEVKFPVFFLLAFFFWVEWKGRTGFFALEKFTRNWPQILRWSFYSLIVFLIGMYSSTTETPFIYFQF